MGFKKKLRAGVMVMALATSMMAGVCANAATGHLKPGSTVEDAEYCDNTYRTYTHVGFNGSTPRGEHIYAGALCRITRLDFKHDIFCSSCGAYMSSRSFGCTISHSKCNTHQEDHPAY